MTLLNTINIGGTDFGIMNNTVVGVSATPAGSEIKETTFTDGFELKAGNVVTVKFTYANTYGDGSTTYPKLTVAGVTGAIRNSNGSYATTGAWGNQALVPFLFDGVDFTILYNTVVNEVTANNMHSVTSNAVSRAMSYSTSEVNTGKKWIDGKPIYKKVIDFGALPNATTKVVAHNITNLGNFTNISAICWNTGKNTLLVPTVSCFNDVSFQVEMSVNTLNVTMSSARDFSAYVNTYVTLEYTKTTD